jgi:hypothetical protein
MSLPVETIAQEADAGAEPVFPPTDPVFDLDSHGQPHILGGFSSDSLDSLEVEPSVQDTVPGDEALADAVRRELREDGSTTSLDVNVFVRRGVVHLRGWVVGLEDADNAAAVASRLPGVRDVVDEIEVALS